MLGNPTDEDEIVDVIDEIDLIDCSKLDPISLLLSSFSDAEHTIDAFKAQNLQYSNLASLNKVDLELLGITNEETQKNMLKDFGSLPKQDDHYEKTLREMDLRHISIYEGKVIQNIEIHLSNMQTLLAAILLKLSIHTEDVIVSEEKFSSNLILKLIDLMSSYCNQMSETLISLKSKESLKKFEQKMKIDKYLRIFAGAGIFAIGGFILFKFLKP